MILSERVRPDCEVAPWVLPEIVRLEKQVSIMSEALARIARGDTTCSTWVTTMPHCEDVAKEALQKVGGER